MRSHTVYLVHGLLGFSLEFCKMRKTLESAGFNTVFFAYKSHSEDIRSAAEKLYLKIKSDGAPNVSLVTHSLGGLVLRAMLAHSAADDDFPDIFRIVMIAPPNQGSVVADYLSGKPIFRFLLGMNLPHICSNETALARILPAPHAQTGIIAGIRGRKSGFNPFIGSDNDGELRPEETKLGCESDFATVRSSHVTILQNRVAIDLTLRFLKHGYFAP